MRPGFGVSAGWQDVQCTREELSLVDAAAAAARPGGVIDCGQSALAVRRLVTLHQLSLVHVVVRVQSRAEANKCMNPLGCVLEIAFA